MLLALLLGGVLGVGTVEYDEKVDEFVGQVDIDSMEWIVASLSGEIMVTIDGKQDSIPSRYCYAEGCRTASLWLLEQLEAMGYEVETQLFFDNNLHASERIAPIGTNPEQLAGILSADADDAGEMWNVIATLPGKDEQQILLTAHYDAITMNQNDRFFNCPGADDNASGVAGVLEAARLMAECEWQHTLRFVLFSGEEIGLVGSKYYAREAFINGDDIIGVFNMDMIAYDGNGDNEMDIHCSPWQQPSQDMGYLLEALIDVYELDIVSDMHISDATDRSDHASFWTYSYPAILLIEDFDDFTPFYHSSGDLLSTFDMAYFEEAGKLAVAYAVTEGGLIQGGPEIVAEDTPEPGPALSLGSSLVRNSTRLTINTTAPVTPVVYDAGGRVVKTLPEVQGTSVISLDVSDLAQGVYWISLRTLSGAASERFTVIH